MALILLRHTRPEAPGGLCYGSLDLGLAAGFEAALAAIDTGLPAVDRIRTSPLGRCRRLADALGSRRGVAVRIDPDLAEMAFGSWEGRLWSELPRAELDAWAADFHHARPHGGESVADLAGRTRTALAAAAALPGTSLLVAHAGIIRAACALHGIRDGWDTRLDFGEWLALP